MSKFSKKSYIVVINGSRKGVMKYAAQHIPKLSPNVILMADTTEEQLQDLKRNFPNTLSYYFYDPIDLRDFTIHDPEFPTMGLYDNFVKASNTKQ